jgi:hypothetical protein
VTSEAAVGNAAPQFTARVVSPDLPAADNAPANKVRNAMVLLSLFSGDDIFLFFFLFF